MRPLVVKLWILYLQAPESGNQEQENADAGVLKNRNLSRSKTRIIAKRWLIRNLCLNMLVDWCHTDSYVTILSKIPFIKSAKITSAARMITPFGQHRAVSGSPIRRDF